jgi:hypothetical protein
MRRKSTRRRGDPAQSEVGAKDASGFRGLPSAPRAAAIATAASVSYSRVGRKGTVVDTSPLGRSSPKGTEVGFAVDSVTG